MVDEKIAIVIPMKLNNERLPNKSFQSLKGLPLCHWTFERCVSLKQKNQHLNIEIYIYCSNYDALKDYIPNPHIKFIPRPDHLNQNTTSMNEVLKEFKSVVQADHYVLQVITSPYLKWQTLQDALHIYINQRLDSIQAVKDIKSFCEYKGEPLNYQRNNYPRTQDLTPIQCVTNTFTIFKSSVLDNNTIVGENHLSYSINNDIEIVDIDTADDLEFANRININGFL